MFWLAANHLTHAAPTELAKIMEQRGFEGADIRVLRKPDRWSAGLGQSISSAKETCRVARRSGWWSAFVPPLQG